MQQIELKNYKALKKNKRLIKYTVKFLVKCIITDTNGIEKANINLVKQDCASGYTIMVSCLPAGTEITVEEEEEDEKGKKKVRKKKKIEDLNYNDKLLVWDFDHGCFTTARPLWLKKKEEAEEYKEIPDDYFYGMRIYEQPRNVNNGNDERIANTLTEYVNNCIANQK